MVFIYQITLLKLVVRTLTDTVYGLLTEHFILKSLRQLKKELLIKNKFKRIKFSDWKCCKLYPKVNFEEDQNYELHDSNINDFIIHFFKDTTFENNFLIEFDDSFNYPDVSIDSSNLIKLLNTSDTEITDILNSNERYSKFSENILDKINWIDHIEIQTYLNNYTIETSKLGESKFNWYLTSTFDSSFEISASPLFHRKSFSIWNAVEFKVNDEYFIYIGEIRYKTYLMMNSRDETAELFDEDSLKILNLDFVIHSLDFAFIYNDYRDALEIILSKLICHNDELESISIQGKTDIDLNEIRELVRKIEEERNLEKR